MLKVLQLYPNRNKNTHERRCCLAPLYPLYSLYVLYIMHEMILLLNASSYRFNCVCLQFYIFQEFYSFLNICFFMALASVSVCVCLLRRFFGGKFFFRNFEEKKLIFAQARRFNGFLFTSSSSFPSEDFLLSRTCCGQKSLSRLSGGRIRMFKRQTASFAPYAHRNVIR